ncbi:MAG: pseudouridine synthase [Terracidiphilus sp.]|jgi:23S rRNA pseudouridine2605 synthase
MTKKKSKLQPESAEPKIETEAAIEAEVETAEVIDPIGDTTDGEAKNTVEAGTESEIETEDSTETEGASDPEFNPKPRPPAKLERLQKILAAAGVASRRSAEAMIEQGRVQINGKVVTVLGTKADAGRDHIRVDGKLLQGAERHRYFVLNKPRGFVTTVKDPEGRPTVMQFFDKMKERLYPVGRLDYMSEGLLVVTNDGELANRLTKASSGVEKTYLVKVAGQPTEGELNILRGGVAIERGKPGSGQVRTSPARIRQVRQGDNPWYEVVLIEGRNRELRKMFEEVGHFVEKIRRVGYGPLVLDQEPGNLRELQPTEVEALRRAAEGKLRTPKSKELRRRNAMDAAMLPTVLPKPSGRPRAAKPSDEVAPPAERVGEFRPKKFGADRTSRPASRFASGEANKLFRPARPSAEGFRPAAGRTPDRGPARTDDRPRRAIGAGPAKFGAARPAGRPAWKKDDRPARPPARFAAGSTGESRPPTDRPFTAKPAWKKPERPDRPERNARPERSARPEREARPAYKRPVAPRREVPAREARVFDGDLGPVRPPNLHIEEITGPERSSTSRSSSPRPSAPRSSYSRPASSRPSPTRPSFDRPRPSRPSFDQPASSDRPAAARPFRSEGGLARPFTTSSGKPRAGGARASSKPFRPGSSPRTGSDSRPSYGAKRPFGAKPAGRSSSSPRPYTPRTEGASTYRPTSAKPYPGSASRAERKAGPGWKPKPGVPTDRSKSVGWKPSFGGPGKPAFGSRSKPKPGSSAKPSHRVKPGGGKRTGPRPGGKPRGTKRG